MKITYLKTIKGYIELDEDITVFYPDGNEFRKLTLPEDVTPVMDLLETYSEMTEAMLTKSAGLGEAAIEAILPSYQNVVKALVRHAGCKIYIEPFTPSKVIKLANNGSLEIDLTGKPKLRTITKNGLKYYPKVQPSESIIHKIINKGHTLQSTYATTLIKHIDQGQFNTDK
jgi:hypothetical protein